MATQEEIDSYLAHHGVKGMKWGVRKDGSAGSVRGAFKGFKEKAQQELALRKGEEVVVRNNPGSGVRTVGGNKRMASEDAIAARTAEQIAKRSTLDALSNKELQQLVTRMNLENQYRNLAVNEDRRTSGERFAETLLLTHSTAVTKKLGPAAPVAEMMFKNVNASVNSNKALTSGVSPKKSK